MRLLGNFLWFILGGVFTGILWWIIGLICFMSIIGIPWGKACFVIGQFTFFPFGKEAISRKDLYKTKDIGTSIFGLIGNIIWFLLFGIFLAISHVLSAIFCFITIIGIPFGIQHLKLALISLFPIGQTIVDKELANEVRMRNAKDIVDGLRA
ncbi:YccF domain-containing protein [Aliarcobacter butzleri]|uniref:YccF domain-containing protein n=1 Tax=Aliarcobacter butzleri TaxID=28197 RepID=UPI002B2442AA|nr:YccF domain-containing protein [Aliarcobacter butzleri]